MAYVVGHAYRMPYHGIGIDIGDDEKSLEGYLSEHGVRTIYHGIPVPSELVPKHYVVQGKCVPDHGFMTCKIGYIVDERVRDITEGLEPGVHRFHEVEVTMSDGSPLPKSQFLLNCCVQLNALDAEKSDVEMAVPGPGGTYPREFVGKPFPRNPTEPWEYLASGTNRGLAVFKDKIDRHAMWSEERLRLLFMSDAMVQAMWDAGIDGFDAVQVTEN